MKLKGLSIVAAVAVVAAAGTYQLGLVSPSLFGSAPRLSQQAMAGTWIHIHGADDGAQAHIEEISIDTEGNYEIRLYDGRFRSNMVDMRGCPTDTIDQRHCGGPLIAARGTMRVASDSLRFDVETENRHGNSYDLPPDRWTEAQTRPASFESASVLNLSIGDGSEDAVRPYYRVPDTLAADFRNLAVTVREPLEMGACALETAAEAGVLDQWVAWAGTVGGAATGILHEPLRARAFWRQALSARGAMPSSDHPTISADAWQGLTGLYHSVEMVERSFVPPELVEDMRDVLDCVDRIF